MVSCHQLKRAATLAEDLEAMQYLSKILLLCLTANLAARDGIRDRRTKAMIFPYTSNTRDNEALTDHVK